METISVQKVETGDVFEWILIGVYGAAQDALKPDFLADLVQICESETLPMLVGGDFNIIRRKEEKNNDNFNVRWPFIFNAIIESLDLREIILFGRQFTWASRREIPTYEKLDRVLANVEWEQNFPLVTVHAMNRVGSDHTPLFFLFWRPSSYWKQESFFFRALLDAPRGFCGNGDEGMGGYQFRYHSY
jgi:hypothetical protein